MFRFVNEGENAKAGIADFLQKLGPEKAARVVKVVHRKDQILVFLDRKEYRDWAAKDAAAQATAQEAAAKKAAKAEGEGKPA